MGNPFSLDAPAKGRVFKTACYAGETRRSGSGDGKKKSSLVE
jgi:hypothetical protein